jgi:L-alanine-DL-glutamate epimerase-like enolase superfamily enzyme
MMSELCKTTPIPIALDEELIGVFGIQQKEMLLSKIQPQYIILKPSLVGGFKGTLEWIELAEKHNIGWWITSALESNIGLNAITQFTYTLNNKMAQGLGTGGLYTNNFDCPLAIVKGNIGYNLNKNWDVSNLGLQL